MADDTSPKDGNPPKDGIPKKATWQPFGKPTAPTEVPVGPHDPDKPRGERQDGAGKAPPRPERTDATPVGATQRHAGPSRKAPVAATTGIEHGD